MYWESLTSSLREIRSNLRSIVLLATALVAATAAGVAAAAHALSMLWGPAWVLGFALAPTDATAVGVLGRALPRRTANVLSGESLVNDGTALVLYGLAVSVTAGDQQFHAVHAGACSCWRTPAGAVADALVAWLGERARRFLHEPFQENLLAVVTPFVAYLLAETAHASGVLAVVVSGLWVSQASRDRWRPTLARSCSASRRASPSAAGVNPGYEVFDDDPVQIAVPFEQLPQRVG